MSHKITPTAAIVSDAKRVAHLEAALKEFHTTSKSLDDVLAEHHGACKPAVAAPEKTWAPAFTFKDAARLRRMAKPKATREDRIAAFNADRHLVKSKATQEEQGTIRVNFDNEAGTIGPVDGTFLAVVETTTGPVDANEAVHSPKHYMVIGDTEACDLIACMLGQYVKDNPNATPYQIYCAGNVFKYRLRAGEKDDLQQDIDKANKYKAMHNG